MRRVLVVVVLVCMAACSWAAAAEPGAVGPEAEPLREQPWLIPSPVSGVLMHAMLYRPDGPGPFPLAVINHGSEESARARARQAPPSFPALTEWFVARGYAVLVPERPGHGRTGGTYLEAQGRCGSPDYVAAGRGTARSIGAAIAYLTAQPFVSKAGVIVVGNSAGGWGALALAAENPSYVSAVVNFAGGRGGRDRNRPNHNCSPDRLVTAAATFGATAHIPTLWLYAENDSYFAPDLSGRMAAAFEAAGGRIEYHLVPPIAGDGHSLIQTAAAAWRPILSSFLERIGK